MAGVDPRPFTLRKLEWLADGRRRADWERTSLLAALFYNQNRKPHDQVEPRHYDPFKDRRPRGSRITPENITDLKCLVSDPRK